MTLLNATAMLPLAVLAVPAAAQSSPPVAAPQRDIVVTGIPIKTTQAQLAACLARKCPPKEDIDASLAHAENAFVAGDYQMARATLLASLGRNRRHAKTLPLDVSDLLRASSRVAGHLGEQESYLSAMRDAARVLRNGFTMSDTRALDARIEVADSRARIDDISTAVGIYRSVARQAHDAGLAMTEGYALLRVAALYSALAEESPMYRSVADRELKTLINNRDPRLGRFAAAASVLRARVAVKRGDTAAVDRLIADSKISSQTTPILIYAPPISSDRRPDLPGGNMARVQMNSVDDQWADIGFWIATDGKVSDVEILRQSPSLSGNWPAPIVASITDRRYAPFSPTDGQSGMQRVERYSLTAFWTTDTGTHLRVRSQTPRIQMLDLTN